MPAPSLYLHVPFCRSRCAYCDFVSTTGGPAEMERYLSALDRELASKEGLKPRTVYIGGGTPTALPSPMLERLLGIVRARADLSALEEWTVEMNPATDSGETLGILAAGGVTRLSIGVQTLAPEGRTVLGRAHTPDEASATVRRAVEAARAATRGARVAGLSSVSLDLIFGWPGQTDESWRRDLEEAVSLGPDHVSAYSLSLEEGTPLARRIRAVDLAMPSPEAVADRYLATIGFLESAGFARYETSNFARPGRECLHNVLCWEYREYEAAGAAACAFTGGERRENIRDLSRYLAAVEAGESPVGSRERLEGPARLGERAMLGLRLARGVDLESFAREEGIAFERAFADVLPELEREGHLERAAGRIRLSRKALPVADSILAEFVASPSP